MGIGSFLVKQRKQLKVSQEKLAEALEIPRSSLSKIENDKAKMDIETVVKWGKAMAMFRSGQACEAATIAICSVDVTTVMQAIMQVLGG